MNYLEVKFEIDTEKKIIKNDFISEVIIAQTKQVVKQKNEFAHTKLLDLGFIFNSNTNGYAMQKNFQIDELIYLTKQIDCLKNHILTYGYINLKIHNDRLYFWDRALIFEGIDTFEYCLKYHNIFEFDNFTVLTKSAGIDEVLLNLAGYTKRYIEPDISFISENCMWDKKEGIKIHKHSIKDINEYLKIEAVKTFHI